MAAQDKQRDELLKWRRLAVAVAALVMASAGVLSRPDPLMAHCPGTLASGGQDYAGAKQILSSPATGIRGDISWTSPTVCAVAGAPAPGTFSLEGIGICSTSSCSAFAHPGWVKHSSWSSPKMFCEFKQAGQQSYYYHFSLSAATHEYRVNYDPVNGDWDC